MVPLQLDEDWQDDRGATAAAATARRGLGRGQALEKLTQGVWDAARLGLTLFLALSLGLRLLLIGLGQIGHCWLILTPLLLLLLLVLFARFDVVA